jgi:hypothetical protein
VNNRIGINGYFVARVGLSMLPSVLCVLAEQTLRLFQKSLVDRGEVLISTPTILQQISVLVTLTKKDCC